MPDAPTGATVQPARLAFGLRDAAARARRADLRGHAGAALHVDRAGGVLAETAGGRVRAGAAVLAINAATRPACGAAARPLTVSSSHIVLTEPVPDVLEQLGWTGGEAISDGRALLHYFRTTPDGRIAFGWGGGRMASARARSGRVGGRPRVVAQTRRDLVRFFPALAGRRIDARLGRPDRRLPHATCRVRHARRRPRVRRVRLHRQRRRALAPVPAARSPRSRSGTETPRAGPWIGPPPKIVPPEPLRAAGATVIRAAIAARRISRRTGGRPDPITRGLAAVPSIIGLHIVR